MVPGWNEIVSCHFDRADKMVLATLMMRKRRKKNSRSFPKAVVRTRGDSCLKHKIGGIKYLVRLVLQARMHTSEIMIQVSEALFYYCWCQSPLSDWDIMDPHEEKSQMPKVARRWSNVFAHLHSLGRGEVLSGTKEGGGTQWSSMDLLRALRRVAKLQRGSRI